MSSHPSISSGIFLNGKAALRKFIAPSWCHQAGLQGIPEWHLPLRDLIEQSLDPTQAAARPTPIQRWPIPKELCLSSSSADPPTFYIKRDDLSSREIFAAGNKLRKLEFLFADALAQDCDAVASIGAIQSNHVRACASVAQRLGIPFFGLVRGTPDATVPLGGNAICDLLSNATLKTISKSAYTQIGATAALQQYKEELLQSTPFRNIYAIPIGGSVPLGTWGYILTIDEIIQQFGSTSLPFEHIVCATGSGMFFLEFIYIFFLNLFLINSFFCSIKGGTLAGLGIGARAANLKSDKTGEPIKVTGIAVCDSSEIFLQHVETELNLLWPSCPVSARELVSVRDEFKGPSYGRTTPEQLDILVKLGQSTGIFLDPVYTLKAVVGMLRVFDSGRVLFIHTGGFLGLLDRSHLSDLSNHLSFS